MKLFTEKIVFEWYNEWVQLSTEDRFNWYTWTIIHLYFEKEFHGYMMQFTFLGLGFYVRYNTEKSLNLFAEWEKEMEEELKEYEEKN